jgi:hypothetical protein
VLRRGWDGLSFFGVCLSCRRFVVWYVYCLLPDTCSLLPTTLLATGVLILDHHD